MTADESVKNVWDDEDELRRMILEAENAEIWQVEEAEDEDEPEAAPDLTALRLMQLRSRFDSVEKPES